MQTLNSSYPNTVRALLGAEAGTLERLLAEAEAHLTDGETDVQRLSSLELGPSVPDPSKIICVGLNYRDHAAEAGLELPEVPLLFAKYPNTLNGPYSPIRLPVNSTQVDYEAELAVVIGRRAKDVKESEALSYVGGYSAMNDVSARDLQLRTSQWMAGKSLDTFGPLGPGLTLARDVPDPQALSVTARLNGQTVQEGHTSNMVFSVAELVAYISSLMTLEPGDIIATGTPAGVGFKRTPPLFLKDGDVVEVEVEGVGLLRNPVLASAAAPAVSAD